MENITDGEPLIRLRGGIAADPSRRLASPADFCLWRGRHAAVTGANGSGKSTLVKMITGGLYLREGSLTYSFRRTDARPYEAVRTVSFNDAYGTTESPYYYQQRWNASDRGMSPSVGGLLTGAAAASEQWRGQLFDLLDMRPLFDRELVTLSSGELRRYHITRALLTAPEAVILESPFIGLDPPTRELLCRVMERVAEHLGVTFVVTVSSASELPPMISDVYQMESMRCTGPVGRAEAVETELRTSSRRSAVQEPVLPAATHPTPLYERVVELRDATIGYGSRTIFEHLDWSVRSGEGWNVTGRNGSGKSTLLILVCADNPRAYALDLTLFDRRRGTGESIWDIKRHIGYLSPEMHRAFADDVAAVDVVASGLFDAVGGGRRITEELRATARPWMAALGAEALADRSFVRLSSGEQRLVLLARAFVKDPDLLILDEPFQGLDPMVRTRAKSVVEAFCRRENKTLLFVTHYPELLPATINRTLHLGR